MKQVLGKKKHKLCEDIANKKFTVCYTNGTRLGHYIAECWFSERDADFVNWKVKWAWPYVRDGERVTLNE